MMSPEQRDSSQEFEAKQSKCFESICLSASMCDQNLKNGDVGRRGCRRERQRPFACWLKVDGLVMLPPLSTLGTFTGLVESEWEVFVSLCKSKAASLRGRGGSKWWKRIENTSVFLLRPPSVSTGN